MLYEKYGICCIVTQHKFWIPAKNILDAVAGFEMNVLWTINNLHPILRMKQVLLMKLTMNVKDISVLLKHHSKKDLRTILETLIIKSMRSTMNFERIFEL